MKTKSIKLFVPFFLSIILFASCSKFGDIPSEVTLRGLKGTPKTILEKSFANDSLLALNQPEASTRYIELNKKGYIEKNTIYSSFQLMFFSENGKKQGDTLITNGFLADTTQISIIKQWKTSDSTIELHEFFLEDGVVIGEISSIKTKLNRNNQPEQEIIVTDAGYQITIENIYSDGLVINQYQGVRFSEPIVINYRYVEFDEHNNWIMRQCIINDENGENNVSYQVREITYFE